MPIPAAFGTDDISVDGVVVVRVRAFRHAVGGASGDIGSWRVFGEVAGFCGGGGGGGGRCGQRWREVGLRKCWDFIGWLWGGLVGFVS